MNETTASSVMTIGGDPHFIYLMQYYARKSGRQAVTAPPGKEAVTFARQKKPAVIVLEADLPGTPGWEVLRALKANRVTSEIPVVICSWLDEETRSLTEGAAGYLRKPVSYGDFVTVLADVAPPEPQGGGDGHTPG